MARLFLVCCIGGDNRALANPCDMGEPVRQFSLSIIDEFAKCFDEDVTSMV